MDEGKYLFMDNNPKEVSKRIRDLIEILLKSNVSIIKKMNVDYILSFVDDLNYIKNTVEEILKLIEIFKKRTRS